MATLTLRSTKGAPLTNAEVDGNFTSLNDGKLDFVAPGASGNVLTSNGTSWQSVPPGASDLSSYLLISTAASTYQPLDGDLTSIAGLAGTSGFLKKTAANTWALDTNTYLTGIDSAAVTAALGYTPYNATNPSGYISGITGTMVTTALGYTPYNSTNPNGYTSNTGTVTSVSGTGSYGGLTLSGTVTGSGNITLGGTPTGTWPISITGNAATATSADNIDGIQFKNADNSSSFVVDTQGTNGIGYSTGYTLFGQSDGGVYCATYGTDWQHQINGDFRTGQIAIRGKNSGTWQAWRTVLDSGNYSSYALPLSGGNMTGGFKEARVAIPASDINLNSGNYFTRTISGTTTLTVSNVPAAGTAASFILDLTNGGSATINWWTGMKWAAGTAPTLTTSGRDVLGFFTHDGGTTWSGILIAKDVR